MAKARVTQQLVNLHKRCILPVSIRLRCFGIASLGANPSDGQPPCTVWPLFTIMTLLAKVLVLRSSRGRVHGQNVKVTLSQGSNVRTSHMPTLSAPCEPKKVSLSASFGVT